MVYKRSAVLFACILSAFSTITLYAQSFERFYNIGAPVVKDIWVDPVKGNDGRSGATREQALKTVDRAWLKIPVHKTFTTTGFRIMLVPGNYTSGVPPFFESRYGTFQYPVILQAAGGVVNLPTLNIFDCRYLYLIGLTVKATGGDVLHCEKCDHFLLRQSKVIGQPPSTFNVQEGLKINQSKYVYVENSDISGAWDNAIDYVSVQYGHVQSNKIHNAGDWCIYSKGGSAYLRIEGNEIYDCGTGGYTAGQGTGFEYMTSPWLHYEAYDVKVINNVIHDTSGAGLGVQGGYNILMAYNTLYKVGSNSHAIEIGFGLRGCDGDIPKCQANLNAGGWGTNQRNDGTNEQPIPNRNVFIYNNILYNPAPFRSQYQQFYIAAPRSTSSFSHIPNPSRTDVNLQIRGNIIWNGPKNLPLGIGSDSGCQNSNPTCNKNQLVSQNSINKVQPQLVGPGSGNFHPVAGGNVFSALTFAIPNFAGGDRPQPPVSPTGNLINQITRDRAAVARSSSSPPGAYVTSQ
jgi:hypothetical protein